MEKNLQNIKQEFKNKGIFYTPEILALKLKEYIDIPITEVYDPTCGQGNLLKVFDENIPKYGQELDGLELEKANQSLKNFTGVAGDTLTNPAFINKKFNCIVANYPFSIKWQPTLDKRFIEAPTIPTEGKADYAFILHILHYLSDTGIASVLNFPGILYRGNREAKIRKYIVNKNWIDKIILIPANTFVDTKIATVLIIFKKNKTTTDITFIDEELKKEQVVTLEEIKKNDYNLSVNQYVFIEPVKEKIDPFALNAKARLQMKNKITADLNLDKMICELENWNFEEYKQDLIKIIQNFK